MTEPSAHATPIAAAREFPARELRRNWWVPLVALSMAAASLAFEGIAHPTAPIGYFIAWLSVVFAAVTATRNAFPLSRPVVLHVATGALAIGDAAPVPASEIAEAKISPRMTGDAMVLLVFRAHGERWLNMRAFEAKTMLEVLGVGAGERRASFSLMLPFRTRFLSLLLVLGAPWTVLLAWSASPAFAILSVFFSVGPFCAFLAWVGGFVRGRLVVGADGFSVRWLGRERFRPFSEVRAVRLETSLLSLSRGTTRGTIVELVSGNKLRLRARDAPIVEEDRGTEARAMRLHLTQAFERATVRGAESPHVTALLGGGGRSGTEWLACLDDLMRDGAGRYRIAAPSPELLTRVATDITSPRETRIGAAAALVRLDPEGRSVVRVAADACADPKLRGTLLSLVDADSDEAVAAVLSRAAGKR
jgi:hypothetical protein